GRPVPPNIWLAPPDQRRFSGSLRYLETPVAQASRRIDIELSIPPESGGVRFDQALAELVPQFSRSRLTAWIRSGQVSVNGKPIKPKQLVSGGERVHIQAEVLP